MGYLIQIIGVLISVAFFTLYERKLLSYSQYRVGPNKVSILGLLQPISDAIKLFSKERILPFKRIKIGFLVSPLFVLFFPIFMWILQPFWFRALNFKYSWLIVFCGCRFNVYFGFLSGWVSNSKYSIVGSFRAICQMISYEVALAFIIIIYRTSVFRYNFISFNESSVYFLLYPLGILWFIICLRESQRTPFDLAEGESELVSGFNTEYRAAYFALLFLGEYMSILFISLLTCLLIFGLSLGSLFFNLILRLLFTLFIWCRCTFPRVRFDYLMLYLWKYVLPPLILIIIPVILTNNFK